MTVDLNDDYGVTISERRAAKGYLAIGEIFDRKTMKNVGITVRGEGRTWSAASSRAVSEAHMKCPLRRPGEE
jgi:hypothetical protein